MLTVLLTSISVPPTSQTQLIPSPVYCCFRAVRTDFIATFTFKFNIYSFIARFKSKLSAAQKTLLRYVFHAVVTLHIAVFLHFAVFQG